MDKQLIIRHLGLRDYETVWQTMRDFTQTRNAATPDELWTVQHPPVFTLGLNGKKEHLLNTGSIPVIQIDRGGQVTYHGPGQCVVYLLLDLHRTQIKVRELVTGLEDTVIELLEQAGIKANAKKNAPGVYVDGKKIASLGLRIKHGKCYHGLSLNVDLDLGPFEKINPCGFEGLEVTQLRDLGCLWDLETVAEIFIKFFSHRFGYLT